MTARLPSYLRWQQRPFPDANLLLLHGPRPALVDTGFVGHAGQTRAWAEQVAGRRITTVVNTHWHADHVGGNAELQAAGATVLASGPDAAAVQRRDPGCCMAEYLDQPVAPYTVDRALGDGDVVRVGQVDWLVVRTPGHTAGHLSLFQPDDRLLVVGDAMSDYDVGWVPLALDGPDVAAVALASLERLAALDPRVLLPAHGPIPADTAAALANARRRAQRLVDDPQGAAWYAARRIFAYALMIRGGLPVADVETYLLARTWLHDTAGQLDLSAEQAVAELITAMRRSGAVIEEGGVLRAAAAHTPVDPASLDQPWPRDWPPPTRSPAHHAPGDDTDRARR